MIATILDGTVTDIMLRLIIQATVFAAIPLLLAPFVRSAAVRHTILLAGMLGILTAPVALLATHWADVTLPLPILAAADGTPVEQAIASPDNLRERSPINEAALSPLASETEQGLPANSSPTSPLPEPASVTETAVDPRPAAAPWPIIATSTWLAVSVLLLLGVMRAAWKALAVSRNAKTLEPHMCADVVTEAAQRLNVRRFPPVRTSNVVAIPAVAGYFHPVVIVPQQDWENLSQEELAQVLVHEGAHAIRRDPIWILLQRISAALFWWHPLVHGLNRCLVRAREEICDNFVLRGTSRESYGGTLLRLARQFPHVPKSAFSPGLFDGSWRLEHRIAGILDERRNLTVEVRRPVAIFSMLSIIALSLVFAAARAVALPDESAGDVAATDDAQVAVSTAPEEFYVELLYRGEVDKPYYHVILHSSPMAIPDRPFTLAVAIDAQQAARIHAHLTASGFYERAEDGSLPFEGNGSRYLMQAAAEGLLREDLGWDLGTLYRLDALRNVLDGEAAAVMGQLLARLSGHRQQWEEAEIIDGVTMRLTSGSDSFPAGHPLPLKLEVMNVSEHEETLGLHLVSVNNTFDVRNEFGQLMPYLFGYSSVEEEGVILPAGGTQFVEEFDLAECYYLRRPGRYTVQFRGDGLPRSNCLHFEITADPAGSADGDPIGRLLPLVRDNWTFGAGPSEPVALRPGSNWSETRCRPVTFIFNGPASRDEAGMIHLWLAADPATAEENPFSSLPTTEYLGRIDRWHVYYLISENALAAWPDAQADIVAALSGAATDVAASDAPVQQAEIPSGQQQVRVQQFEVELIHPSMADSEVWRDLRERLQRSAVKYRVVEIDENGRIRLSLAATPASDLSHLQGAPLTSLDLSNTGVRDLTPLQGMPLEVLDLSGCQVVDLGPLRGMKLTQLNMSGLHVRDLSPLQEAELHQLVAIGLPIEDLSPLSEMPLEYLDLRRTQVHDLSPLAGLPLGTLQLEDSPVRDLTPLRETPITTLCLSGLAELDLSQLQGIPLKRLVLVGADVADISPLQNMPLESLTLENTSVRDLTPIQTMPLTTLSLMDTPISDLSPLAGMSLRNVYLSEPGTDLSPLAGMALETIALPPIATVENLELLRDMPTLQWIRLPDCKPMSAAEFWQMHDSQPE